MLRQHGGVVLSTIVSQQDNLSVIPGCFVWSSHVFPMLVWVSSEYSILYSDSLGLKV